MAQETTETRAGPSLDPLRIERQQHMLRLIALDEWGGEYACAHLLGSTIVGHHVLERRAVLFANAEALRAMVGRLAALVECEPPASPEVFEALAEARELLRATA